MFRRDLDVNMTPMAIDFRGRKFLVGTSKECRHLVDGSRQARWRGPPDGAAGHAAALQRCAGVRWQGRVGRDGGLGGWPGTPVGDRAVLRPGQPRVQGTARARGPTNGGVAAYTLEQRAGRWELVPQWLSRDMDMASTSSSPTACCSCMPAARTPRRCCPSVRSIIPRAHSSAARSATARRAASKAEGRALCARRADRRGAVEQRQRDHDLEPLQRVDAWPTAARSSRRSTARFTPSACRARRR